MLDDGQKISMALIIRTYKLKDFLIKFLEHTH